MIYYVYSWSKHLNRKVFKCQGDNELFVFVFKFKLLQYNFTNKCNLLTCFFYSFDENKTDIQGID